MAHSSGTSLRFDLITVDRTPARWEWAPSVASRHSARRVRAFLLNDLKPYNAILWDEANSVPRT
jgi:hypothetical protein